mgnify:CR=1 FL=1
MPLRIRLTLLYTAILGAILLIFGATVYGLVSIVLINQVDEALVRSFNEIFQNLRVDAVGNLNVLTLPNADLSRDIYVQVWSPNGHLQFSNIPRLSRPLDSRGLQPPEPIFRHVRLEGIHLRVLSVPLKVSERSVGVLQLATSLEVVDTAQSVLVTILTVGSLASMGIAGLVGWLSLRQALAPLEAVTETALLITRADDLSRRIPYHGPPNDEIGQLIEAFNQTLGRLENLFNTQRRFLADVGHELRTPLTVIKGNLDLMRRMGCSDEESLEAVESEVNRLTRLVGDLLLLAQAESGELPLDKRIVELDTLLLEVLQQMRVLAGQRVKLQLEEIDQVLVCGDRDRLKQVLVNLIDNAIHYTPAGGKVSIALGKVERQAWLTVSDTGPGIPEEDLPHIFERFYRGEKSRQRSRDGKGFGLGLSIAYWIVNKHEGKIEVNSKIGQGTTFRVWLPLAQEGCESQ